jgi:hypothetical protein
LFRSILQSRIARSSPAFFVVFVWIAFFNVQKSSAIASVLLNLKIAICSSID